MILNRMGNKRSLANKIIDLFPKHDMYIEPFFGAGGLFFNKPKVKYNILNDIDEDVYNLFRVIVDKKDEFVELFSILPITEKQFKEWSQGKREETDIMNAIRFIVLSNYSFLSSGETMKYGFESRKELVLSRINYVSSYLSDVSFMNCDFRKVFDKIGFRGERELKRTFCYCDPPYLDARDSYRTLKRFTEEDSYDLFETLEKSNVRWAMSEFEHPFILNEANKRNLNIIEIDIRRNLFNHKKEILITNYDINNVNLFNIIEEKNINA